jgi:hypothetical protein
MKFGLITATIGVVAVVSLAGCFGAPSSSNVATSPIPPVANIPSYALPSGVDSRFAGEPRLPQRFFLPQAAPDRQEGAPIEQEFFISDAGSDVFVFKNSTYKKTGTISKGLSDADGMWVDAKGNLYVANATGPNVLEYKKGAGPPVCTYSARLSNPVNVTTDKSGNVYVADFGGSAVREYGQCSNKVKSQITINQPEGVAVDEKGNIFVAYFGPSGGNFEKFTKGTGTMLGATVTSPGGIILDKKSNLIADDQGGSIDLIKPPYASAKILVRGLSDPFHASLNAKEDLLFNANAASSTVTIYTYPAMKLRKTITTRDGINAAEAVAESPNAIF